MANAHRGKSTPNVGCDDREERQTTEHHGVKPKLSFQSIKPLLGGAGPLAPKNVGRETFTNSAEAQLSMAGGKLPRLSELSGANRGYTGTTPTPQEPPGPRQTVAAVELALAGPELQGRPGLAEAKGGENVLPQSGDDHYGFSSQPDFRHGFVTR